MLSEHLGNSASSLYAAFGSTADLFGEAVGTYARRYSEVYDRALAEPTASRTIHLLLQDSVLEFTRAEDGLPGCLTTSAAMTDTSETLDVRSFLAQAQQVDEDRLRTHLESAARAGDLPGQGDPAQLAGLLLTIWQGLSTRAALGVPRAELLASADLAAVTLSPSVTPPGEDSPAAR